jgi:hypothetical protein
MSDDGSAEMQDLDKMCRKTSKHLVQSFVQDVLGDGKTDDIK